MTRVWTYGQTQASGRRQEASYDARRLLIGGGNINKSRNGRKKNKSRRIPGSDASDHRQGVRGVEGRLVVIRGVELGRRAAAGSWGRRAREEFADWEPRRLRKSRGFSGAWKREPGRNTGDPGRHTGNSGAGESREERGGSTGIRRMQTKTKINRRIKVLRSVKYFSINSELLPHWS